MDRRFRGLLIALFVGGVALAIAAEGLAHKAGGTDMDGIEGCGPAGSCHPVDVQSFVLVTLEGLPEKYQPGQTYTLTLTTGPEERARASSPGGYAIDVLPAAGGEALPGFFTSIPGDKNSKLAPGSDTMTHTDDGTDVLQWSFNWTAPRNPTTVRFWATGMLSGGIITGQDSDVWNTEAWLLEAGQAESPAPLLGAVLALATVAFLWRRK